MCKNDYYDTVYCVVAPFAVVIDLPDLFIYNNGEMNEKSN